MQKMPTATETIVEKWWLGICQSVVRRRLEVAKNRIKVPGLSAGDVLNLQKQILDLQEQLHEFPRPVGGGDARCLQLPRGRPKVLDQILNQTNLARHSKRRGSSRQSSARRLKSSRGRSVPKRRLNSQGNHSKPPRLNSRKRTRIKSSSQGGNHNGSLSMPALGVTGCILRLKFKHAFES
jgi:hypothetical protein